jgi:Flp pilus assembly protein TadD
MLAALALAAAVFATYAPVAANGWVRYDDDLYLTENPGVAEGLGAPALAWAFSTSRGGNYHPLTWLAHQLDVELFGLEPGAHHLVSVGLHAIAALLVLHLLRELVGSLPAALFGAGFYALHPLRVESVAWAAERKDVLCALLFIAAVALYLRHGRAPSAGRYALVCATITAALLAKPTAVVFPLVALGLDAWPLARLRARRAWHEKAPLFLLAAAGALATLWAQRSAGATNALEVLGLDLRLLNSLRSLGVYALQTVAPLGLSVFYPHPAILASDARAALVAPAAAGALLILVLALLAWRTRRSIPAVALGLWIAAVLLLPVIGWVQVGSQAHADRYTLLPSFGLALAAAGAGARVPPRWARALSVLGLALLALLAGSSRRQVAVWRDTRTLFEHALRLDPENYLAHVKLGELALHEDDGQRARAHFERALALHPRCVPALSGLALCQRAEGELDAARAALELARRLRPGDDEVLLNLAVVEMERGALPAARLLLEECRTRAPRDADVLYDLGCLAQLEGRAQEAERCYLAALEERADFGDAWVRLGQLRLAAGRPQEARAPFERALELAPEDPAAHYNLGVLRRALGDESGAAAAFARSLALEPDFTPAREALAELRRSAGDG